MDSTDKMNLLFEAAHDDDFLALDLPTQALYFYLVTEAECDQYVNDYSAKNIYTIAKKIGLDDDNVRKSVETLINAQYLLVEVNVNFDRGA